jgi:phosphoglycerol transferase MdoB-like AlkP superfamily enzyme
MRLLSFVLALLLLAGTVEPTQGWLITLVVLTGVSAMRLRLWSRTLVRPALDMRLAAFVLSILLLAGTVDATRDWLIALSAVTGVAAFMPRMFAVDRDDRFGRRHVRMHRRYRSSWDGDAWS